VLKKSKWFDWEIKRSKVKCTLGSKDNNVEACVSNLPQVMNDCSTFHHTCIMYHFAWENYDGDVFHFSPNLLD